MKEITLAEQALATVEIEKQKASGQVVEAEGTSLVGIFAQLKQGVGDLALYDDISVECDIDQAGPRAKSHFRFRAYRKSSL